MTRQAAKRDNNREITGRAQDQNQCEWRADRKASGRRLSVDFPLFRCDNPRRLCRKVVRGLNLSTIASKGTVSTRFDHICGIAYFDALTRGFCTLLPVKTSRIANLQDVSALFSRRIASRRIAAF
jgi:hypothetical protein